MATSPRRRGTFNGTRDDGLDLNFAQRLLLANENAVTNIADLWAAAAINVDNKDPFESDSETERDMDQTELVDADLLEPLATADGEEMSSAEAPAPSPPAIRPHRPSIAAFMAAHPHRPSVSFSPPTRPTISLPLRSPDRPSASKTFPFRQLTFFLSSLLKKLK